MKFLNIVLIFIICIFQSGCSTGEILYTFEILYTSFDVLYTSHLYKNGKANSNHHSIKIITHQNGSRVVEVHDLATDTSWPLPVYTGKLTYPLYEDIRFSQDDRLVLIPVEDGLSLFEHFGCQKTDRGRSRCYSLWLVDIQSHEVVGKMAMSASLINSINNKAESQKTNEHDGN